MTNAEETVAEITGETRRVSQVLSFRGGEESGRGRRGKDETGRAARKGSQRKSGGVRTSVNSLVLKKGTPSYELIGKKILWRKRAQSVLEAGKRGSSSRRL